MHSAFRRWRSILQYDGAAGRVTRRANDSRYGHLELKSHVAPITAFVVHDPTRPALKLR
jgi:hypothetical protein